MPHFNPTSRGFTLVELMVVVAILSILTMLAAPTFTEIILNNHLSSTSNRLVSSASMARTEAIKRNVTVTLCQSSNASTCGTNGNWELGWIIKTPTEVLLKESAAPAGYKVTGTVSAIDFDPVGVGTTVASLTVCRATPSAGSQERVIAVSATGKAISSKTTTGSCL